MKFVIVATLISSLALSGCFSSPTDKNGEVQNELHLLWEYAYDLDGGAPRAKPLIRNSMIITSGDIKVTSLNYNTGELIWKTHFDFHRQLMNRTFGLNENILAGSINRKILAWNIITGDTLWELHFPDSLSFNHLSGIAIIPDGFLAVSNGGRVYNVDMDGNFEIIQTDSRTFETLYEDGILFMNQQKDQKGIFSALNMNSMELVWRFEPGAFGYPAYSAPILENDILYVGTTSGPSGSKNGFFALDAQTGEELWRREGIFTYSAVLAGDRIFGVNGQRVWALDKHTGEQLWITRGQGGHSESNLDYMNGHVYWAHGGGLHVFDAESGELVYVQPSPDGSFFWRVTAGAGRIFAQSNRHLYAFAPWGHQEALE